MTNQFFETRITQVSSLIAALVEFAVFLITSTTWNKQVDMGIYLLFYCC